MATLEGIGGQLAINGVVLAPAGASLETYSDTAPAGYFPCDGREISQTDYPELYAAIGDIYATFGGVAAPGAGNFRIPPQDIGGLGLYSRGTGATNGPVGTYQGDVFKSHGHTGSTTSDGAHTHGVKIGNNTSSGSWLSASLAGTGTTVTGTGTSNSAGDHSHTVTVNNTGDTVETRPQSITVLKCISAGREII